jgi:hypothetical protein
MMLPVGRKEFNYTMDIRVNVFDRFGDYSKTTTQVKVRMTNKYKITNTRLLQPLLKSK